MVPPRSYQGGYRVDARSFCIFRRVCRAIDPVGRAVPSRLVIAPGECSATLLVLRLFTSFGNLGYCNSYSFLHISDTQK